MNSIAKIGLAAAATAGSVGSAVAQTAPTVDTAATTMTIQPLDGQTFYALLTYVVGASLLASAAILGVTAAIWSPKLVGKFLAVVARAARIN